MPHELTTAPTNSEPKWPSEYIQVLREAGAQERTIPFCIRWVRGFFAEYPGRRRRELGRTEIEAFLRKTAARPAPASIAPAPAARVSSFDKILSIVAAVVTNLPLVTKHRCAIGGVLEESTVHVIIPAPCAGGRVPMREIGHHAGLAGTAVVGLDRVCAV